MADININLDEIQTSQNRTKSIRTNQLADVRERIAATRMQLDGSVLSRNNIGNRLKNVENRLSGVESRMSGIEGILASAYDIFSSVEATLFEETQNIRL